MRTICNTLYVGKLVQVPIERGSSYRRDDGKVLGIGGKQVTVQLLEGRQETFEMRCTDFYEYAETKNLLSQNPELQRIEKKRVEQMQKLENYCKK
jgi:hypothetical protein